MSLENKINERPGLFSTPLMAAKKGLIVGLISIPLTYFVDPENHKNGLTEFLKISVPVALITPAILATGVYVKQKVCAGYELIYKYFK
jgi:hypothetical protein